MKKTAYQCDKCKEIVIISENEINQFVMALDKLPMEHYCPTGGTGYLSPIATITTGPKTKCWGC